eukprot:g2549.t1
MRRADHFSTNTIDLDNLSKIQEMFGEREELNEEDFVEQFGEILGDNLTAQQLTHLFMKIDANSDGTVDWDEFTNYMFLDNQDTAASKSEEDTIKFISGGAEPLTTPNFVRFTHKSPVHTVQYIEKCARAQSLYASASTDGVIHIWHANSLKHYMSIRTKDKWLSSIQWMPKCGKIAAASVHDGVKFFDLSTDIKHNFAKQCGVLPRDVLKQAVPLSLYNDTSGAFDRLFIGDDQGIVNVYKCDEFFWHRFGTDKSGASIGDEVLDAMGTLEEQHQKVDSLSLNIHDDYVTKVMYVPDLNCMISSSLDSTVKVFDLERNKSKRVFSEHIKGVYSFAWTS